jgi:hypothetical protein
MRNKKPGDTVVIHPSVLTQDVHFSAIMGIFEPEISTVTVTWLPSVHFQRPVT